MGVVRSRKAQLVSAQIRDNDYLLKLSALLFENHDLFKARFISLNNQGFINRKNIERILDFEKKKIHISFSLKWFLEATIATVLLVVLFPLMIVVYLSLFVIQKKFPIFTQARVGVDYSVFKIYKFRTLSRDLKKIAVVENAEYYPLKKAASSDTRRFGYGSFLRKWKIDELPQLINIIKGNMSFVGPRPFSLEDTICCPEKYKKRFEVKPGITGYWQAFHKNTIDYKKKFLFDSYYVKKKSILLDLLILLLTPYRVLKGED